MALQTEKSNLLERFRSNREIVASGFKVEPIGKHNIRVIKGGRMLGIWRQSIGSFAWVPAGQNHPQTTVVSVEEAARHLKSTYGAN